MSGHVSSVLGGGPGSISQVRDRLELLREPVNAPRLGIDASGYGISDTQVLAGDCRRVHNQRVDSRSEYTLSANVRHLSELSETKVLGRFCGRPIC